VNNDADIQFGILNFGNLANSAFGFRFLDISREFEPAEYDEHQRKVKNLENVENYFKDKFPTNKNEIKNLIPEIQALGHQKVDDISVKVAKYISDYLSSGATMQSLMENRMATKEEMELYIQNKVGDILAELISQEFSISSNSEIYEELLEFSKVITRAGVNFFISGFGKSGPAINAAFISGVGTICIWASEKT
jgi:uncharacterized protein YeeX (DUF496 family)